MSDDTWDIAADVAEAALGAALNDSFDDGGDDSYTRREAAGSDASVLSPFLRKLFAATQDQDPARSRRETFRAIVEQERWFVPLRPDGGWETIEAEPRQYRRLIETAEAVSAKKRKSRNGKGGRLLPLYATEPARTAVCLDGRAVVHGIPADVTGLLLHFPERAPRELGAEYFDELRDLAEAGDVEAALVAPGPNQAERLLRARWWVETDGDALHISSSFGRSQLAVACTGPDRVPPLARAVTAMEGERLFRLFLETPEADGIVINRTRKVGSGAGALNQPVLSPAIACALLEGRDIRPGVNPLPAHSRAEVALWLNLRRFPREDRRMVDAPLPDALLLRAMTERGNPWRMQETAGNNLTLPGPLWSPVFTLAPDAPEEGFAETASRILCPGLLADHLGASLPGGKEPERYGRAGRWLLFGRYLSGDERARSRNRALLATELAKFLPPGGDRIPRRALQTVEGATLFRRYPHAARRDWIEAVRRQAARYARRWVWGIR